MNGRICESKLTYMKHTRHTPTVIRNRIIDHVTVRAGDLIHNEKNPRVHDENQEQVLRALYEEVGFARSLTGYRTAAGPIKLIDGHLRASLDPEQMLEVEILDVTEEEADKLLLSLDPLTALASYDMKLLDALGEDVTTESDALMNLWAMTGRAKTITEEALKKTKPKVEQKLIDQYLVICTCTDEIQQRDVLRFLKQKGLEAKAVMT